MRDDGTWQVRDTAGSGKWHTVLEGHCTCPDYTFRHMTCKHLRAVAAEERALAAFCDEWNTRSEQQRTAVEQPACDQYSGPYGSDGWPQPRPCCPTCGAELDTRSYYIGGRGYQYFEVCSQDMAHHARQA
jgi:hypothetical protein